MSCGKEMSQLIPTQYHYKEVKAVCGQTSIHGSTLLCNDCIEEMEKAYPQGWLHSPGDTCIHGTFVGGAGGPDYMCGKCENGELE